MAEKVQEQNYGSASLAEGENVSQNFANSSVNVVTGDQINVNVYNVMSAEADASSADQEKYSTLINIVNANTRGKTTEKILDHFKTEGLYQPDFQVNPHMRKVKVEDYFKGRYQHVEDMEVTTKTLSCFGIKRKKVLKNQLRKEIGFTRHEVKQEDDLTFDQVLKSITGESTSLNREESSIVGIVASAGSGKTTLMRRLARKSLDSFSPTQEGFNQDSCKMIYFVELKAVQYAEHIKPSKCLFGGLFKNEADVENAYQWLLDNQTKAILYFDGLDQAAWKIDYKKNSTKINPFSHADTATIMYNILSGNLFPQAKIVFASREFRVSELPTEARPSEIISPSGFTPDDAEKLFVFLIGKEGAGVWDNIRVMSPRLLNLVSVPVFLMLTAVVMARDPTGSPPTTVTELYRRIIAALRRVENVRQHDKIDDIIFKLKEMAYRGMMEGRVVFHKDDLRKSGVDMEDVKDLIMKVPCNNLLSRHLIEGDFIFFFCHQSIQEFLAASFIAHMTFRKFSQFDKKHLHQERWSVVRRFVAGLVYEKSTDDLHKVSHQTKKQRVIARSIRSQLDNKKNERSQDLSFVRMELYTAIYESDDNDMMKNLSGIQTPYISLTRDEAEIVGSLAARNESLDYLFLNGSIDGDKVLEIIARCLKSAIHVKEVNLGGNNISATALCSLLAHRRIASLSGNLHWNIVELDVNENHMELSDKEDAIEISSDVEGHFNMKESTLVIERCADLAPVLFCGRLFDAEFIKLNEQQHLLTKQDDLRRTSERKLGKITKILFDCTEEENIDWPLIETSLKKYQVDFLDIVVNTSIGDYTRILERGRNISAPRLRVNAHAMFVVETELDYKNLMEACQQKKIEYIRCIFDHECRASLDEISSLVSNSNSKKVTLIYRNEHDMLQRDELKRVLKIANDFDTDLEVLKYFRKVEDAWKNLDRDYFWREWRRRRDE